MEPEIFAPGIISSKYWEHSPPVFSQDSKEVYWSVVFDDQNTGVIYYMKRQNDQWTKPEVISFSESKYRDICPSLSSDGKTLYFTSSRPVEKNGKTGGHDMWFVKRKGNDWSEPQLLAPNISTGKDARSTFTRDEILYFGSWREGATGGSNLYRSKLVNGIYTKPENLDAIFSGANPMPSYVAPDESYMIFESFRTGGFGGCDFWISLRQNDGSWEEPKNLGAKINSKGNDWFGGFSPDMKYFFFVSDRGDNNDIYWVNAKIIDELRPKDLKETLIK
ncbi:MAG: hypothetical protein AB1521_07600 [Bacteroidota bacterium]